MVKDLTAPALAILPIGAERAVKDQCQEWRMRHARSALDGDLARLNAKSPGGWQLLQCVPGAGPWLSAGWGGFRGLERAVTIHSPAGTFRLLDGIY
jgi:hypothetical protein